jgi:hypothetical protein
VSTLARICAVALTAATVAACLVSAPATAMPDGVTAGVAVFDRRTGRFTESHDVRVRFRSASIVKLLLALDYLWERGPAYDIPDADRTRLEPMLRSSDDAAAGYYWRTNGYEAVVDRMVARLGLHDTAGPPAEWRNYWGYTAISAADTVRIYRYLLDEAPAAVRTFVMDNLRLSTRCAVDHYDQSFGIPSVFGRPWAVKQGWSGFGDAAPGPCAPEATAAAADVPDLVSEALHTTGVVGAGDRSIVVVYTLHPDGTAYGRASADLNRITRRLRVPGATRP